MLPDSPLALARRFGPYGLLLAFMVLWLPGATARAGERPVIPAGEETRLREALIPENLSLPAGLRVEGLAIFPDRVELSFRETEQTRRVQIAPGPPPRAACLPFGPLHVCPDGKAPPWLRDYLDQRLKAGAATDAAAAWSKTEGQKDSPPPAPLRLARDVLHGPGLIVGAGALCLWLLTAGIGLWRNRAMLASPPPHPDFRLQWREGWLWGLMGVLLLALLVTAFGAGPLSGLFNWLRGPWFSDDAHRALAVHLVHAPLWLAALLAYLRLSRQDRSGLRVMPLVWAITLLAIAPHLASNLAHMDPESIFIEWQAPVWLAAGRLPHFGHYLMGVAAPASWVLAFTGLDATGINAVRLLAALVWGSGLFAAGWSLGGVPRSGWLSLALGASLPVLPFLATEGWWFMAGTGMSLLTLAALEQARRLRSEGWGFLALLLAFLAFELRLEGVVLLAVWLLVRVRDGRISRRLDRAASLVFSFNLLRLAAIAAAGDRVGGGAALSDNLLRYLALSGELWPWILLSLAGLWFFWRHRPESALCLLLLTLGWWGIHLLARTVPSHRELLTLFAPLLVLGGGALLTAADRPLPRLRLVAVGLVLLLALPASWPVREQWQQWRERADRLGVAMHASLERLPADLPLLLDPVYLRLVAPDRLRILETPNQILPAQLLAALEGHDEAICFNDLERSDACCFYEINPGPPGENASDPAFANRRCWPVSALGWWARPEHREGALSALRLIRPPEPPP